MKCGNCGNDSNGLMENCLRCGASLEDNQTPRSFFFPFKRGRKGNFYYANQAFGFLGSFLGLIFINIFILTTPSMSGWTWIVWSLFMTAGLLLVLRRSLILDPQQKILTLKWGLLFNFYSKTYHFSDFNKVEFDCETEEFTGGEVQSYGKGLVSNITLVGKENLTLFTGMGNMFYGRMVQKKYGAIAQAISRIMGLALGASWDGVR